MEMTRSTLDYMQIVSGKRGHEAVKAWLYWKDDKGQWRQRYLMDKRTGRVIKWTEELAAGRAELIAWDGASFLQYTRARYVAAPDALALRYLRDKFKGRGKDFRAVQRAYVRSLGRGGFTENELPQTEAARAGTVDA